MFPTKKDSHTASSISRSDQSLVSELQENDMLFSELGLITGLPSIFFSILGDKRIVTKIYCHPEQRLPISDISIDQEQECYLILEQWKARLLQSHEKCYRSLSILRSACIQQPFFIANTTHNILLWLEQETRNYNDHIGRMYQSILEGHPIELTTAVICSFTNTKDFFGHDGLWSFYGQSDFQSLWLTLSKVDDILYKQEIATSIYLKELADLLCKRSKNQNFQRFFFDACPERLWTRITLFFMRKRYLLPSEKDWMIAWIRYAHEEEIDLPTVILNDFLVLDDFHMIQYVMNYASHHADHPWCQGILRRYYSLLQNDHIEMSIEVLCYLDSAGRELLKGFVLEEPNENKKYVSF